MVKCFQLSLRELGLVTLVVALLVALYVASSTESDPMYLHVFGSMVDSTHDDLRPAESPMSPHGPPWTRIASVEIYDGRPFGFFTPNDRMPSIGIDGRVKLGLDGKYRGDLHFWLDDGNLTFDFTEMVVLTPDEVVTIDPHYDIYLLSSEQDPYRALSSAMRHSSGLPEQSGEPSHATEWGFAPSALPPVKSAIRTSQRRQSSTPDLSLCLLQHG